jgi:hypothetical protein
MPNDSWEQRYLAIVPEKLTARDASVLLDLIEEDAERFVEALAAFALSHEEDFVCCECSPGNNPACDAGHPQRHIVEAEWRISEVDDRDDFFYLCTPCKDSRVRAPGAQELSFEGLENEEVAEDA